MEIELTQEDLKKAKNAMLFEDSGVLSYTCSCLVGQALRRNGINLSGCSYFTVNVNNVPAFRMDGAADYVAAFDHWNYQTPFPLPLPHKIQLIPYSRSVLSV